MCGVCGEVRFDGRPACAAAVRRMTRALAPRGPDGEGVVTAGRLAFGHRRLAVIDPSEHASQPMVDDELGLGVVYNGAVYNHRELRAELAQRGYRFTSASDTEVLLKAYHAWGEAFVERLDGMFAFALWERDSGRVLLARDRLGIKPLYHAAVPGGLRFASSLPALLAGGGVDTAIDPVGLHGYMTFQGAVPAPRTLLAGVRKLPAAHLLRLAPDGTTTRRAWWWLRFEPRPGDEAITVDEWRRRTLELLRRAVRRRAKTADVPVGVLLSGGLDSSLLVALLAELEPRPWRTFSIAFDAAPGQGGDELACAARVAERFATEHRTLRVDTRRLLGEIEPCVAAMSEPLATPDCLGFYLLARQVCADTRVVLTGQGADELFAGYGWYPALAELPANPWAYAALTFNRGHSDFRRAVHPRWVGENHSGRLLAEHFESDPDAGGLESALNFDTAVLLPEDSLKRVDDMTMAWGVEARVPYLCHELAELAARLPAELKVGGGGKRLLKDLARAYLPRELIERPKAPFPVPPLKRLDSAVFDLVRDVLSDRRTRRRDLFQPPYVDALLAEPPQRRPSRKLWQMAVLELWLRARDL